MSDVSLISDLCSARSAILRLSNLKLRQYGIRVFNLYIVLLSLSNRTHGNCGASLCLISDSEFLSQA